MCKSIFRYLILLCLVLVCTSQDDCPMKCICKQNTQRDGPHWLKIRCGDEEKIRLLEELDLSSIANEILQLNLSNNHLTEFSPKVQLTALQKLDLSKNQLTILHNNQFANTPNLKKLDISKNSIKYIDISAFDNLPHLDKLKLNQNLISSLSKAAFKSLLSMKQLDISANPLVCNCDLLWILEWSHLNSVKLVSNPRCDSPDAFKGVSLKKIKIGVDIYCKSSVSKQWSVYLHPFENQVVFEGDSLKLNCQASSIIDLEDSSGLVPHLEWTWLDSDPKNHFETVVIENKFLPDLGLIDSSLTVPKLERNHTGIWNCSLISDKGNQSKGITVIVISEETQYCPMEITSNNKGTYMWPRTVVNFTVTMTCEQLLLNSEITEQKASYFCSPDGHWENLNTTDCAYVSETTRILEQFSKVNLNLTKANILESAKHFRNHTGDLKMFKDIMDLIFVAQTIENYLLYLELETELGAILIDVINNIVDLPVEYVHAANIFDQVCNKLVKAVEIISGYGTSFTLHKANIATEQLRVQEDSLGSIICMWFRSSKNTTDKLFSCVTKNGVSMLGNMMESSVQVPASLFHQLQETEGYKKQDLQRVRIIVTMYKNNKFFPINKDMRSYKEVTSPVVGVKLVGATLTDLTEPIYVMMKRPPDLSSPPTPVWWDTTLNNSTGSWSSKGCELKDHLRDNLVFSCKNLGYYGLLQNISYTPYVTDFVAKFKFSHPAIYVGSFILITSLIVAIMTYLLCYNAIQMPKKAKHSLINSWIAVSLLCFMFVFGIYQTENKKICQAVGLILHYLTLCSLLWMCVGVNCMYKRLIKNDSMDLQDDELPSEQPIQKPILGLYLVGWGVALIVCGISGAVNMREYASHSHCFLNSGPSLSAVYIPVIILLVLLSIFFLVIRCAIYSVDTNGHLSEGTQATENVDLDLLEPNFPNPDNHSVRTTSTKTASSEIEDPEHAPSAQLKAYIVFLVIYVFTWSCCAMTIVQPFKTTFEYDMFSIGFAVCATTLGAFTLFFYCVARNDVRTQWSILLRSFKRNNACFRPRHVSDASSPNVTQIHQGIINNPIQELQITSRSSSRSSSHTKSNSHTSNIVKAATDLNGSMYSDGRGTKINNVNLIVLHRQQYRSPHIMPNLIENPTNSAEMFYNPHQSTVARKFFRKQKRHLMKRNNLPTVVQRDINSDTASVMSCQKKCVNSVEKSIFGNSSKVNNTNIHVERIRKSKHKNPNILSDSCDECEELNIPVEKLVINADRLRRRDITKNRMKKKQNIQSKESVREPNMRSVSQQCTLEYSSETISDSILDKASPEKCISFPFSEEMGGSDANSERPPHNEHTVYLEADRKKIDTRLRIFTNPAHNLELPHREQSITSSVSASEIDELYQQIRRGPFSGWKNASERCPSPPHSDSEINVSVNVTVHKIRAACSDDSISDKVETTV